MRKEQTYSVILDTSFLIRFLSKNDEPHQNAYDYFRYFLKQGVTMFVSTVTIAEYRVNGDISELPLLNVRIIPFNIQHAQVAGKFAKTLYTARRQNEIAIDNRLIFPNDAKIFAQAECIDDIKYTEEVKQPRLLHFQTKLIYSQSLKNLRTQIGHIK